MRPQDFDFITEYLRMKLTRTSSIWDILKDNDAAYDSAYSGFEEYVQYYFSA